MVEPRILISTLYFVRYLQLNAYKPVIRDVEKLLNGKTNRTYVKSKADCEGADDCWTISVTGHSLGGFIATIVGSTLGINVIDCNFYHIYIYIYIYRNVLDRVP